jgi:uncharacterized delta-60 repeat protein
MATQPDGKIVIAGYFTSVDGAPRSGIARLNRDGTLDASFQNGMSGLGGGYALSVSVAPDGHVAIVGAFESVNGVPRSSVAKLNPDGSLDAAFEHPAPSVDGSVEQSLQLPDGRIVVGGSFAQLDGAAGRGIARLLQDGSVDPNFHGAVDDGSVGPFARQPDGRLVVTGSFTSIGGVSRNRIARLEADGSLDTSFQNGMAGLDQPATAVVLQPDGRIVIGGDLSTVGGVARARVARLNADGSLDPTFGNAAVYAYGVTAIAVQPDGRIVIGGEFESVAGVPRGKVARLNADGTLDASFQNGMSGLATAFGTDLGAWASSLALMADGRVLVGGKFQRVNGAPRSGIARLNADGSLDVTFQNGMPGADGRYSVDHVSEQSDGRVLVAGRMSTMNLENTGPIARVYGTAPVAPAITTQPANQVSYEGSCAVFHVGASGTPVDYRWRKGGVDLVESATVSGTKSSTLTLTGVTAASAGSYDVVIGNVLGTESSMTVTLTVDPVPECRVATCDAELGSVLVVASPPEITALRIDGHSPSSLGWSDPGGAVFDVVSSTLGDLRTSGTTGATCLANDVETAGYSDTRPNPSAGNGYYYLVRAQSSSGSGNYGSDSAGVPRAPVAACP